MYAFVEGAVAEAVKTGRDGLTGRRLSQGLGTSSGHWQSLNRLRHVLPRQRIAINVAV
jgi:hypothetical protein